MISDAIFKPADANHPTATPVAAQRRVAVASRRASEYCRSCGYNLFGNTVHTALAPSVFARTGARRLPGVSTPGDRTSVVKAERARLLARPKPSRKPFPRIAAPTTLRRHPQTD